MLVISYLESERGERGEAINKNERLSLEKMKLFNIKSIYTF